MKKFIGSLEEWNALTVEEQEYANRLSQDESEHVIWYQLNDVPAMYQLNEDHKDHIAKLMWKNHDKPE